MFQERECNEMLAIFLSCFLLAYISLFLLRGVSDKSGAFLFLLVRIKNAIAHM